MYNFRKSTIVKSQMCQELATIHERAINPTIPLCGTELSKVIDNVLQIASQYPEKYEECNCILDILTANSESQSNFDRTDHPVGHEVSADNTGSIAAAVNITQQTLSTLAADDLTETLIADESTVWQCSQSIFADCDPEWLHRTYIQNQPEPKSIFESHCVESTDTVKCTDYVINKLSGGDRNVHDRILVDVATQCTIVESADVGVGTFDVDFTVNHQKKKLVDPSEQNLIVLSRSDVQRIANRLQVGFDDLWRTFNEDTTLHQQPDYSNDELPSVSPCWSTLSAISATPP